MILKLVAKSSDMNTVKLIDKGETVWNHEGEVPYNIGLGGGDYVKLEIDAETGQIQNWQPIDVKKLTSAFEE
jgi:hypothetical protein